MQVNIIVKDILDGVEVTYADMAVEVKTDHATALHWAAHGMLGIVQLCTEDYEDDSEPPVYSVLLTKVEKGKEDVLGDLLLSIGIEPSLIDDAIGTVLAGGSITLKEGLSAADAMDLSDKFHAIGCVATIA